MLPYRLLLSKIDKYAEKVKDIRGEKCKKFAHIYIFIKTKIINCFILLYGRKRISCNIVCNVFCMKTRNRLSFVAL